MSYTPKFYTTFDVVENIYFTLKLS